MKVLLTGGAGYIGSHTAVCLLEHGHEVVIIDNFSNSKYEAIENIEKITNAKVNFYKGDVLNKQDLINVFSEFKIDAVIHFAGLKAVGESVRIPIHYYNNNITGTLVLLEVMKQFEVYNIVFSSSATVYGDPITVPIDETFALGATNPYGRTKLFVEEILKDVYKSDNNFNIALLRYFNPVGAHKSGLIGEDPNGIPNNLMPYITQVAAKKLEKLSIFGNDYNTEDGTGVRDYIHVLDLAEGHVLALNKLTTSPGVVTYNLGTGVGYSVLDMVNTFIRVNNVSVDYQIVGRRAGDIAQCYANPQKAYNEIGFKAKYNLEDMCKDSWNFQVNKIK